MQTSTTINEPTSPRAAGSRNVTFSNIFSGTLDRVRSQAQRLGILTNMNRGSSHSFSDFGTIERPSSATFNMSVASPSLLSQTTHPPTSTSTIRMEHTPGLETTNQPSWDPNFDFGGTNPTPNNASTSRRSDSNIQPRNLFPNNSQISRDGNSRSHSNAVDHSSVNTFQSSQSSVESPATEPLNRPPPDTSPTSQIVNRVADEIADQIIDDLGQNNNNQPDNLLADISNLIRQQQTNMEEALQTAVQRAIVDIERRQALHETANEQVLQRLAAERAAAELATERLIEHQRAMREQYNQQSLNTISETRPHNNHISLSSSVNSTFVYSCSITSSTTTTVSSAGSNSYRNSNCHQGHLSTIADMTSRGSYQPYDRQIPQASNTTSHNQPSNHLIHQAATLLNQAMAHTDTSTSGTSSELTYSESSRIHRPNDITSKGHMNPYSGNLPNSTVSSTLNELSSLFSNRFPNADQEKFTGDIKKYDSFRTKFRTLMASSSVYPDEQAKILYQSLSGEVISQLDFVPNLSSPSAYEKLWEALDAEYGKYQNGAASYVTELITKLQHTAVCKTSSELQALHKTIKFYYNALDQLDQVTEIEHISIRMQILGKLTGGLSNKFNNLIEFNPNSPIIRRFLEILKAEIRLLGRSELAVGQKPLKGICKNNQISSSEANSNSLPPPSEDAPRSVQFADDLLSGQDRPSRSRHPSPGRRSYEPSPNRQSGQNSNRFDRYSSPNRPYTNDSYNRQYYQSPNRSVNNDRYNGPYQSPNRPSNSGASNRQYNQSPNRPNNNNTYNRQYNPPPPNDFNRYSNFNSSNRDSSRSYNSFRNSYNTPQSPVSGRQSDRPSRDELTQRFSRRCFFCLSDDHDSESCNQLSDPLEYKDILYKFKLCFNCLHQGHSNTHCLMPRKCIRGCNDQSKHSSVICRYSTNSM